MMMIMIGIYNLKKNFCIHFLNREKKISISQHTLNDNDDDDDANNLYGR